MNAPASPQEDFPLKTLKHSSPQSLTFTQLCASVAIREAVKGDQHGWGNATDTEPAFLVYLGCQKDEVAAYIQTFNTFYRTQWCEVRFSPRYLQGFKAEIQIRGMQRYSDSHAFGLDSLVESESAKHFGADFDEYNYYATGYMPPW